MFLLLFCRRLIALIVYELEEKRTKMRMSVFSLRAVKEFGFER